MKKFLFSLLAISWSSQMFSQQCADSVKTAYYYHENLNSTTYTIYTDTFDLDSGKVVSCSCAGDSPSTLSSFSCTPGYWSKNLITLNLNGDTLENLVKTGSANGWQDDTRRVYTYDALTSKILSEGSETWNGSSWDQTALHSWVYNGPGKLLEETIVNFSSGNTFNVSRNTWSYTGSRLDSRTIQTGNGTVWINIKNYLFIYDAGGFRDSVTYMIWNTATLSWETIGTSAYYFNGMKLANFNDTSIIVISGTPLKDSVAFSIDTLENIISYYELRPDHIDAMGDFYSESVDSFAYINGQRKIVHSESSDYFDDHSGSLSWYCTNNDGEYHYDSSAYLIQSIDWSHCVMPYGVTRTYYYDANHVMMRWTSYLDANTQVDIHRYNYFYANADSMIAYMDPFNSVGYERCPGDILRPRVLGLGGCGNYSYNWSPATGLSSVSVPDPLVVVGDTINYIITVTDTAGHVATQTFTSQPFVQISISIDTNVCVGCPGAIHAQEIPNFIYRWYRDGLYLAGEDSSTIIPNQDGNYYLIVSSNTLTCFDTSNVVYYSATLAKEISNGDKISLQPNPSSGISRLRILSAERRRMRVGVSSISSGAMVNVFEGDGKDFDIQLDGGDFSPGVYIVFITSENSRRQLRWVVTR